MAQQTEQLCRCEHPKHASQCPNPTGCWCDTFTDTRTIYVGSLWHQDCDPFIGVVGFDSDKVEAKLAELETDEYARCMDVPEDELTEINIMSSGVHTEAIIVDDDAAPYFLPDFGTMEYREALDDLERDGIAVI